MVGITGIELMDWVDETSRGWKRFITAHPEVFAFPCDIRETKSVAELLQHIIAVELRYAERLNELPVTPYGLIPCDSAEAIYATHDRAMELLRPLMNRDDRFWETVFEMQTRSAGIMRATRRTVLVHLLMPSIRHYARLATLARKQGVAPDWAMDYIAMHTTR